MGNTYHLCFLMLCQVFILLLYFVFVFYFLYSGRQVIQYYTDVDNVYQVPTYIP